MTSYLEILLEDACPDLKVCNCASCGMLLIPEATPRHHRHYVRGIKAVFLVSAGVPFCRECTYDGQAGYVLDARKRGLKRK